MYDFCYGEELIIHIIYMQDFEVINTGSAVVDFLYGTGSVIVNFFWRVLTGSVVIDFWEGTGSVGIAFLDVFFI